MGRCYPQAVYFPIRTLYLTLRAATARKTNTVLQQQSQDSQSDTQTPGGQSQEANAGGAAGSAGAEGGGIKASPPMVRCSKIMKMQRDIHTTVLSSLEGIADQVRKFPEILLYKVAKKYRLWPFGICHTECKMLEYISNYNSRNIKNGIFTRKNYSQMEWFRENWYEEVGRQLRQGLAKCYAIAFENRETVNEAKITPHILNFVKKLVSTFGIGVENITSSVNAVFHSAASESLARRAEAAYKDPVYKEMKAKFTKEFDSSQLNSMKLHVLIFKLKKWIKILEDRSKELTQYVRRSSLYSVCFYNLYL